MKIQNTIQIACFLKFFYFALSEGDGSEHDAKIWDPLRGDVSRVNEPHHSLHFFRFFRVDAYNFRVSFRACNEFAGVSILHRKSGSKYVVG